MTSWVPKLLLVLYQQITRQSDGHGWQHIIAHYAPFLNSGTFIMASDYSEWGGGALPSEARLLSFPSFTGNWRPLGPTPSKAEGRKLWNIVA